ncbi:hypothetical protein [Streptomyces sp. 303MFCol5.2]|uniref:hypothetical protein n=1 Tax=Streptomyces sp. 303MFCol5.2 TaxID=1172181 RepID=UPI00131F3FD9|nr:hypothetical protein [Streptomyces sp. 303MFCol5.2]
MAALTFGLIASLAAVLSILFAARQTRELARQTVLNNGISAASAVHNSLERLHAIDSMLFENPQYIHYFYAGCPVPHDEEERLRVLTLANMFADSLDYGLLIKSLAPETDNYECWNEYVDGMLANAPAIRFVVSQHPTWWPSLSHHSPNITP